MIEQQCHFRAKNEAAYELLREILVSSVSASQGTIDRFLSYLTGNGKKNVLEAIDLNVLFRFFLVGKHLLIIPKTCFRDQDILVLKNFCESFAFNPERIEFSENVFYTDPNVYLPGYVRHCMKGAARG